MYFRGAVPSQIAAKFDVEYSTVKRFLDRHAEEITKLNAEATAQLDALVIADKVERISALNEIWLKHRELVQTRAADKRYKEPGYSTGLMTHSLKAVGSGPFAEIVDEYKYDAAVVSAITDIQRKAAEELGQLPKSEQTINVGVFVRQVAGYEGEIG